MREKTHNNEEEQRSLTEMVEQYNYLVENTQYTQTQIHEIIKKYSENENIDKKTAKHTVLYNINNIEINTLGSTQKYIMTHLPYDSRHQCKIKATQTIYESFERLRSRGMIWYDPDEGSPTGSGKVKPTDKGKLTRAILEIIGTDADRLKTGRGKSWLMYSMIEMEQQDMEK